MRKGQIKLCNLLSAQLEELKRIYEENFNNFCVGIYYEDYYIFRGNNIGEIKNDFTDQTAIFYKELVLNKMTEIEIELKKL